MKAKPLQTLITTPKGILSSPLPKPISKAFLTSLCQPSSPSESPSSPDPNKAHAQYEPCNMLSLKPFPNFATCSAGMARASGYQAMLRLCLPGTSQDTLTLVCSLKITDVTPLFCILQCQEPGFFTNNPLSSLPRRSQPRQRSPAQSLAHRHPSPHATCLPRCRTDNMAKGVYCKGRVSPHNCKTKQEHRFRHGLQYHVATEPRQASKQTARILTRENFQEPHALDRTRQLQPEALVSFQCSHFILVSPQSDLLQGLNDVGSNCQFWQLQDLLFIPLTPVAESCRGQQHTALVTACSLPPAPGSITLGHH